MVVLDEFCFVHSCQQMQLQQGGVKKGDKIHGQKKGKKGEAAAYVTRAQARVGKSHSENTEMHGESNHTFVANLHAHIHVKIIENPCIQLCRYEHVHIRRYTTLHVYPHIYTHFGLILLDICIGSFVLTGTARQAEQAAQKVLHTSIYICDRMKAEARSH